MSVWVLRWMLLMLLEKKARVSEQVVNVPSSSSGGGKHWLFGLPSYSILSAWGFINKFSYHSLPPSLCFPGEAWERRADLPQSLYPVGAVSPLQWLRRGASPLPRALPERSQRREGRGPWPPGRRCHGWKSGQGKLREVWRSCVEYRACGITVKIIFSGFRRPWVTVSSFEVSPVWNKILDYRSPEVPSSLNLSLSL